MAAGTYKGLTIRIGADTTQFASGLRGINSAIYKTQTELNKLKKASNIDGGNFEVASRSLGAFSQQITNTAANIDAMRQSIDQIGDIKILDGVGKETEQTVSQFLEAAKATGTLALEAEKAQQAYDKTNSSLEKLYRTIKKESNGEVDIRKATNEGTYSDEWLDKLVSQGKVTQENATKVKALKREWDTARAALDNYANATKLNQLSDDIATQRANFNALSRELVNVSREMAKSDRFKTVFADLHKEVSVVNSQLAIMGAAAEVAGERFRNINSSMTVNYGGFDVMRDRTLALNEALETTEAKADLLRERISAYESRGIDRIAQGMGNVALEVQNAERQFVVANTQLAEMRANSDATGDQVAALERKVAEAQKRMDTAHAVQQWQRLTKQLHQTRSEATELALKLVDINRPSTAAANSTMRLLERDIQHVTSAMKTAESDATALGRAVELNPQNMVVAEQRAKLLGDALRLASAEGEELQKKYDSYDHKAIAEAADYTKTAAEQTVEAARAYDELAEAARAADMELANARQQYAKNPNFNNAREQGEAMMRVAAAQKALADAQRQLDLSKQREEVEKIDVDMAKNAATADRLKLAYDNLGRTDATPKYDLNVAQSVTDALDRLEKGRGDSDALRSATEQLRQMSAASEDASSRFERLDAAAKLDSNNIELANARTDALTTAITANDRELEALNAAMAAIPADRLDQTAIAAGTVAAKMADARQRFDEAKDAIKLTEDQLKLLTDELRELEKKQESHILSDDETARMEELRASIDAAEASMSEYRDQARQAFGDIEAMRPSEQWVEMSTRTSELTGRTRELREELRNVQPPSNIATALEPLQRQLAGINGAADATKSRFDALSRAAQLNPYSLTIATERSRALADATNAAREKAENLRRQIAEYKSQGLIDVTTNTRNAEVEFAKASDRVGELRLKLKDAEDQFGKNSQKAQELGRELENALQRQDAARTVAELKKIDTELINTRNDAREMRQSMVTGFGEVGAAAVQAATQVGQLAQQAGQAVIESSRTIDSSYRDLRKTFDAEEEQYKALYDAAMEYGQAHVTSADKMLEMESIAAQLGIGLNEEGKAWAGSVEEIQRFADVAANLDVATNIDSETIALQMGQIANVMKLDSEGIEGFGDALVRLGNTMPTQESNIMQITQRLAAVGSVANFTTPQLMGWAASIAGTGQRSEAAATAISNTITQIQKAVGAGGDSLELFAKTAGMTADEFAEQWRSNPTEALEEFVRGLDGLDESALQRLEDLEITGVRQTQTLLALAQTVDTVDGAIGRAEEAWQGGGDAAEEATKKAQGFSGAMSRLENSSQVFASTFGDAMVPYIELAGEKLRWLTDMVSSWSDETRSKVVIGAGAFTALATVAPVLGALGGNLAKMVTGGIGGLVSAFGMLAGGGLMSSVAFQFGEITAAAQLAAEVLMGLLTPVNVVVGAIAILGGALAYDYITKTNDAKRRSEEFSGALDGINAATEDLGRELYLGSDAIDDYSESWSAARVDMDKYYETLQGHIDANSQTRSEMGESIGLLNRYQDIIGKAAGKGDEFTGSLGELQWALDGLADITGESYDINDVLAGKYEDEAGKVHNLKDEIDQLIETKKREARVNAVEEMLTETYKAQMENDKAYKEAVDAYHDYVDAMLETRDKLSDDSPLKSMTDAEYIGYLKENDEHMQGLVQDRKELREVDKELAEQEQDLAATLGTLVDASQYAKEENYGYRESIMQLSSAMSQMLEDAGIDNEGIKRLSQGIADAGVSAEDLARITDEQFGKMVDDSGGHVNKLIGLIAEYNSEQFEDKYAGITFDENGLAYLDGERVKWNNEQWEPVNLEVNADEASDKVQETKEEAEGTEAEMGVDADNTEAKEAVDDVVEYAENKEATVKVGADTGESSEVTTTTNSNVNVSVSGTDDIAALNKQLGDVSKGAKVPITTTVNKRELTNLQSTLKAVAKTWTATLRVHVNGTAAVNGILQTLRDANNKHYNTYYDIHRTTHEKTVKNARGGYVPGLQNIPRHADGFIATQPTLTQYGWIGEDGAEAYSGGSLVPLTNRKYSQPYIDDISDAVARKLGPTGAAPQISVVVNGVSGPDEVASAIYRKLNLLDF